MTSTASAAAKPKTKFSPFFPTATLDPEEIAEVRVHMYVTDPKGREQRKPLPRSKHLLEIDPFSHTDQDFIDAYQDKPGTYYVEPIGHDGQSLKGGHNISVVADSELEPGDEAEEPDFPDEPPPRPVENGETKAMMEMMRELFKERERAAKDQVEMVRDHADKRAGMYENFTETMFKTVTDGRRADSPNQDVVQILRDQIEEIRKKAGREEDDLRKTYREDLARRDRDLEDLRRAHREEIGRRDREIEESRSDFKKREDELRRRWTSEEEENRRKWREEVSDLRTRYERELNDSRSQLLDLRTRMQTEIDRVQRQVYDLQKENLDLAKELASTSDSGPSPLEGANSLVPADSPAWMKTAAAVAASPMGARLVEAGGKVVDQVARAMAQPAPVPVSAPVYAPPMVPASQLQAPYVPPYAPPGAIPVHPAPQAPFPQPTVPTHPQVTVPTPRPAVVPTGPVSPTSAPPRASNETSLVDPVSQVRPFTFTSPVMTARRDITDEAESATHP